jgi:pimeloyl-ACP methyl ester carboxylesterase
VLPSASVGDYLNTNGVRTYYEVAGDGEPVVLLHGGMSTAESWLGQLSTLAQRYRVYIPERRGHGRTADVDGPITFEVMAEDTAAFMDAVGARPAHVVGWSDGAVVAALLALRRPDLVRKTVLIGQYFALDGMTSQCAALFERIDMLEAVFRSQYDPFSPDGPDHFPVVFAKMRHLWQQEPNIALQELARIEAPTLLIQGDRDLVDVRHTAAVAEAIPDAQMAVVPGASHAAPVEKPDLVNRLILDFLAEDQAPIMFDAKQSTPLT